MISAIFTTTEDLDAEFPAVAARRMGLNEVPLMCAREIPVPGAMTRVIRVMLHTNAAGRASRRSHVYLGETRNLRADLERRPVGRDHERPIQRTPCLDPRLHAGSAEGPHRRRRGRLRPWPSSLRTSRRTRRCPKSSKRSARQPAR